MKKSIAFGTVLLLFFGLCISSSIGANVGQTSNPLNNGPLAWWEFDEGSGSTAYDSSGHGYDGTVVGASWTDYGLDFDGMDDYVDFDAHSTSLGMNKTDDYIVLVRFRSTVSGMLYSMSHTNPTRTYFDLMLDNEGKIGVIMGDETCTFDLFTTGSYNDGDWYIIECVFLGDPINPTLELIIDGELEATTTEWLSPMLDEDFLTVKVGRNSNTEEDYFAGEIDDIKIYKNTEPPPPPPRLTITGPDSGKPGQTLTFIFRISYSEECDWEINIDWGDGTYDTIGGPSNTDIQVSHVWENRGTYTIAAYPQDDNGIIYPTVYKQVIIPRNKAISSLFLQFLQSHPNQFQILIRLLYLFRA